MKIPVMLSALALASAAPIPAAADDAVVEAFYGRCMAENSYEMEPAELDQACACMAPVMVSFLTPEARQKVEAAIKTNTPVGLSGNPFRGNPAELARMAVVQCPAVGEAMYRQKCTGNEGVPECQEMKEMLDQVP